MSATAMCFCVCVLCLTIWKLKLEHVWWDTDSVVHFTERVVWWLDCVHLGPLMLPLIYFLNLSIAVISSKRSSTFIFNVVSFPNFTHAHTHKHWIGPHRYPFVKEPNRHWVNRRVEVLFCFSCPLSVCLFFFMTLHKVFLSQHCLWTHCRGGKFLALISNATIRCIGSLTGSITWPPTGYHPVFILKVVKWIFLFFFFQLAFGCVCAHMFQMCDLLHHWLCWAMMHTKVDKYVYMYFCLFPEVLFPFCSQQAGGLQVCLQKWSILKTKTYRPVQMWGLHRTLFR